MEPVEPQDTCRPVEIDGQTIRVHGAAEMTEEDRGHFATIVRAAQARMAHGQTMEVIRDIAVGDTTPTDLEHALLSVGWVYAGEDTALIHQLLTHPHRNHHVLDLKPHGWALQHPLAERVQQDLFACPLNARGEDFEALWYAPNVGVGQWVVCLEDGNVVVDHEATERDGDGG